MQFGSDYSSVSSLHSFLTAAKDLKGSSADSVKLIADYLGLMLKGVLQSFSPPRTVLLYFVE